MKIGSEGRKPRLPTEPCIRITYTAPHIKRTHFLISNQCSLLSLDLICKPCMWMNHPLGKARSTAVEWDSDHLLLFEKDILALFLDTPRFTSLLNRLRLLFC